MIIFIFWEGANQFSMQGFTLPVVILEIDITTIDYYFPYACIIERKSFCYFLANARSRGFYLCKILPVFCKEDLGAEGV